MVTMAIPFAVIAVEELATVLGIGISLAFAYYYA